MGRRKIEITTMFKKMNIFSKSLKNTSETILGNLTHTNGTAPVNYNSEQVSFVYTWRRYF